MTTNERINIKCSWQHNWICELFSSDLFTNRHLINSFSGGRSTIIVNYWYLSDIALRSPYISFLFFSDVNKLIFFPTLLNFSTASISPSVELMFSKICIVGGGGNFHGNRAATFVTAFSDRTLTTAEFT